jgi:hypothetical protein
MTEEVTGGVIDAGERYINRTALVVEYHHGLCYGTFQT